MGKTEHELEHKELLASRGFGKWLLCSDLLSFLQVYCCFLTIMECSVDWSQSCVL